MKKQHPRCQGEGNVENKPIISYLTPGQVISAMKKSNSVKGLRGWRWQTGTSFLRRKRYSRDWNEDREQATQSTLRECAKVLR